MSATCALQVDDQLTWRIRLQEVFHLLHELLHGAVSCKAPHNPWMPANVSSKSPVIVRVMEMPAIDLQHCDAIQSWLSIGPPRSRCHYQDVRAIQSLRAWSKADSTAEVLEWWNPVAVFGAFIGEGASATAVNAALNFLWHFGICWELLWNVLPMGSSWLGVIANIINPVCEHLNTGNWLPSMDAVPFFKSLTSPRWAWACSDNRSGDFPVLSWCVSSTPWTGVHWLSMKFRLKGKVRDPSVEVPPVPNPENVFSLVSLKGNWYPRFFNLVSTTSAQCLEWHVELHPSSSTT